MSTQDLEAKIVVLGAQGVGKTSLLTRFIHNTFLPPSAQPPTIGASFLTKRLTSPSDHPASTIRLQIWDTAGQERFRSISKLYYRGANAAILCYDITDERSFAELGTWLKELREYNSSLQGADGNTDGCVVHVVGTKADIVAEDPRRREVPFERCITYVAEQLHGYGSSSPTHNGNGNARVSRSRNKPCSLSSTSSASSTTRAASPSPTSALSSTTTNNTTATTPMGSSTRRSSCIWGVPGSASSDENTVWDSCHEISAKDGEGVEEVFRVIVRKLVEQKQRREKRAADLAALEGYLHGGGGGTHGNGYGQFDASSGAWRTRDEVGDGRGSFRLGKAAPAKRRSWLMGLTGGVGETGYAVSIADALDPEVIMKKEVGGCC